MLYWELPYRLLMCQAVVGGYCMLQSPVVGQKGILLY